eukprot:gnl/TRDRNA2_/TRDRNA2_167870_c0_seq3.p1 gnl/TRDRNA2_/TRDRNA2_167870_c0~~gnl/TRDRNA2_/TRDRNA2_167870_c0_seq3.p1  ORF type:complete len:786 (+),score=99.25 gnl/TRDRNA2_/TRDRNA2_167870_c0_seq3:80-2359(+)
MATVVTQTTLARLEQGLTRGHEDALRLLRTHSQEVSELQCEISSLRSRLGESAKTNGAGVSLPGEKPQTMSVETVESFTDVDDVEELSLPMPQAGPGIPTCGNTAWAGPAPAPPHSVEVPAMPNGCAVKFNEVVPTATAFTDAKSASLKNASLPGTVGAQSHCSGGPSVGKNATESKYKLMSTWIISNGLDDSHEDNYLGSTSSIIQTGFVAIPALKDIMTVYQGDTLKDLKCRLVLDPDSKVRATWDIVIMVLVGWDVFHVPFSLFDSPMGPFFDFMTWMIRIFWTLDMGMSLITGFYQSDGSICKNTKQIARRYLRTWFTLDVLVVGLDWLEVLLTRFSSGLSLARWARLKVAMRLMRSVRLLRLARVGYIWNILCERICNTSLFLLASLLKTLTIMLVVTHVMACLWYGLHRLERDNWVRGHHQMENAEINYLYTTSFYWALTQFTGGMDEVRAHNVYERTFSILTGLFGFISAAAFVSNLASSLTCTTVMQGQKIEQFAALRRYLNENRIHQSLRMRVLRNAQHVETAKQKYMPEDKVELLSTISEPLRVELAFFVHSPVLRSHPFFKMYCDACPNVMSKVCFHGVTIQLLCKDDVLFTAGETLDRPSVFFVLNGQLKYSPKPASKKKTPVAVQAESACSLTVLQAKVLQDIAKNFHSQRLQACPYAEHYVQALNETPPDERSDLNDPQATMEMVGMLYGWRRGGHRRLHTMGQVAARSAKALAAKSMMVSKRVSDGGSGPSSLNGSGVEGSGTF